MKHSFLYSALLGIAACSVVFADDYTLDGTEEPDNTHFAASAVDAPARIAKSAANNASPEEERVLVRDGDIPLNPPILVKMPNGELKTAEHYTLVQYNSRARGSSKSRNTDTPETDNAQVPKTVSKPETNMTEAERAAYLKQTIRTLLTANARRGINTLNNTPGDVLLFSLPYGADAKVYQPNPNANPRDKNAPKGSSVYSVGALCWNYPCAGKTMFRADGNRVYAKVGYGYQQRSGSLLAAMAMANIMQNYELKVLGGAYSIADLIESEKASVSAGQNLSLVLVGLSFYGKTKETWRNDFGETWNIERLTTEELNRSIDQGSSDVTDWLLGITAAVKMYEDEHKPMRGALALAKKQIKTYQDFVLSVQNDQYLWHPKFFLYKGTNPDVYATMYASGHILRWLLISLPEKELKNPQITRAVSGLAGLVNRIPEEATTSLMNDYQLESLSVSLHALSLYNLRTYGGEEVPPQTIPETKQSAKSVVMR